MHKDDAVASVGRHRLYRSQLNQFLPKGVSAEDSTKLALQYINSWASEQLFLDVAEKQLSKEEKDVTTELEDYKKSLLKYRYEQRYINERLDTSVTEAQIEEYYDNNRSKFRLETPVVKASFLKISKDSPNLDILRHLMTSRDEDDVHLADSLAYMSARDYTDFDYRWVEASRLAEKFGIDYVSMLSRMSHSFIEGSDSEGNLNLAYVFQMIGEGEYAPVEYSSARIKDIILSARKHSLVSTLEQDLIEKARDEENFVIY
ncbi:MAG: hypothetical protein WCR48_00035 [Bacteroidales bacterium]